MPFPHFPNNSHIIVSFPKHWISSPLIHFLNLFCFSNIFVLYITSGSRIFNPLILKFSYSIFGSIVSTISVPYLSTCLSNLSLLLLVSLVSNIVIEIHEKDLMLSIIFCLSLFVPNV